MFVQVIQGRTSQPEALVEAFDRWKADLSPGAIGWLGSTGGSRITAGSPRPGHN